MSEIPRARRARTSFLRFPLPVLAAVPALLPAPTAAQELPGEPVAFESHGATLRGRFFRAAVPGARPAVVLLHGYPGSRGDVLGLGEVVARAGWSVLTFSPRGFHDSEGTMSLENTLEDVPAALAYLRRSAVVLGVDTTGVAVIGYSFGGWLALMSGIRHPQVRCVGAVAPGNLGLQARMMLRDPDFLASQRSAVEPPMLDGRVRGAGWDAAFAEMTEHAEEYDVFRHADALVDKPVLVIGGWRDQGPTLEGFIVPLARALRAAGNERVTPVTVDDDHALRRSTRAVQEAVTDWLTTGCFPPPPP